MSHTVRPMTQAELERWYADELCEAFVPAERKPLAHILELRAQGRYELLGLFGQQDALLGYASIWQQPGGQGLVLLDYLGVSAPLRGSGLGGQLCAYLAERYGPQGLVLESEAEVEGDPPADNAVRRRRIGFYRRHGFSPAYEMATCGLRWVAMLWGPLPDDLGPVMAAHRALYGPGRTDVRIPLPPGEIPKPPYWMKES